LLEKTRTKLEAYNAALAAVDQTFGEFRDAEKVLSASTKRVLLGVAFKYGRDSNEYEVASGKSATTSRRRSPKPIEETKPVENQNNVPLAIGSKSFS
jgi:hypothetical protein